MTRQGLLVVAGLSLLSSGCGKPELKEFKDAAGRFSVLMPSSPEKQTTVTRGLNLTIVSKKFRNGELAVGYTDVPPDRQFDIHDYAGGIAGTHAGKVLSNNPITYNGLEGWEFEVELTAQQKRYCSGRVFMVDRRFYQMLAIGSGYRLSDEYVKKFLDSFKVEK